MFRRPALFVSALTLIAAVSTSHAQQTAARTPLGAAAIETGQSESGIQLTISVPGVEPQIFDGVGDALVPMRAGGRSAAVIAFDIDRDGIDEIFVRTSAKQRGVLIVFRWDASANSYAPVTFSETTGSPKSYLFVHLSQQVSVNGGTIEANHDSVVGGRKRQRTFRYRWTGAGFEQSTDH